MSLSTHVLDTARGRPAADVPVRLELGKDNAWLPVAQGKTDFDGRLSAWTPELSEGTYRLVFDTGQYLGVGAFYPEVVVTFLITEPGERYHVPLLLSPFGYSTYRGS